MKFGLAPWGETISELVDAAVGAEAAGFDEVWTSEFARSSTVPAAAIATATDRVTIGTAITLGFVRSPLVLSLETLDLAELSGGRFVLGLGTGVKRLNEAWHGVDFDPAATRMAETVRAVRAIVDAPLDGAALDVDGEHVSVHLAGFVRPHASPAQPVAIHLAAVGPLMLRTCGEVADGWIAHELGSPDHLRNTILPAIDAGRVAAGRPAGSVRITASACCVLDDDLERARDAARATVAFYAAVKTYRPFFASHGFDDEAVSIQRRFRAGDLDGAAAAVTDAMVDEFCLCGPPEQIMATLGRYDGLADAVKLSPPTHHTEPARTRAAQRAIIEMIADHPRTEGST